MTVGYRYEQTRKGYHMLTDTHVLSVCSYSVELRISAVPLWRDKWLLIIYLLGYPQVTFNSQQLKLTSLLARVALKL